ncbi:MAG: serine protease [Rubrivivax sp.]|jgi:hypothetical protein
MSQSPHPRGRLGAFPAWRRFGLAAGLVAGLALPALSVQAAPAAAPATATPEASPAPTGAGQRIYERTRAKLLQVRTLLKTQDSQSSVGSGFLVEGGQFLVTNYHVVSQFALRPEQHRLVYATVDGRQGALELLAFDVLHDLALLRPVDRQAWAGRGAVELRPADETLPRGARIYSLGNPLDVGFAVAEGAYNGPAERSFLPTLFFGGSLSGGMSGGPALDEQGRLIGVNVAARRDGEQVSFLVPAAFVRQLIERGRQAAPIGKPVWPGVTEQLRQHQAALTDGFLAQPWRDAGHPSYRVPVPQETWMRCWGQGSPQSDKGLQFERSDCAMVSRVYVSGSLQTGFITVRHEAYDGQSLGRLRFGHHYSANFTNEVMGADDKMRTAAQCRERTLKAGTDGLPLRAVICLRAYKKLPGLHDLVVMVATLDGTVTGVQGRLDALGVTLDSAQRLTKHYLDGFAWNSRKTRVTPAAPAASR